LKIDPRVLTLLPPAVVKTQRSLPVSFINNRLTLAMTDPNNLTAFDDVRRILRGVMIEPVAVAEEDFKRFLAGPYADAVAKQEAAQRAADTTPGAEKRAAEHRDIERRERPAPKVDVAATLDLLQSEVIRELQVTDDQQAVVETKQDLMTASEDAPIVKLAN